MTYHKPSNVTYTEMAIYVDKNIYSEDCDSNKCFEYIYHLFYMLSYKGKFFKTSKDYDEFSLYGATQLYMRYKNKKQFETNGTKKLPQIKSCLNYIKKIIYPLKINYQKSTFAQLFTQDNMEDKTTEVLSSDLMSRASNMNNQLLSTEFEYYLTKITTTIKYFLRDLPYNKDRVASHNIYLSCLLTLLKTITISNKNKNRIHNKENKNLLTNDLIDQIYQEEMHDNVIVYHLDKSMENYIGVLVNRLKKYIAKDLRYLIGSYEPSDAVIKSILASPMEEYTEEQ